MSNGLSFLVMLTLNSGFRCHQSDSLIEKFPVSFSLNGLAVISDQCLDLLFWAGVAMQFCSKSIIY